MATVLVVDDDSGIRKLVSTILEMSGHQVLTASNGLEGLMVYSSYHSRLDLVITDIDMPQMNGVELVSRIRAIDPRTNIIVMSGRPLDDLPGLEDCVKLPKPFQLEELRTIVNRELAA